MDLRGYLRAVRKNWWIVAVVTVLGIVGGLGLALGTTPRYASSVTFFVSTPSDGSGNALQSDQYAQARVNTYVQLLDSDRLATEIATTVGGGLSAEQVVRAVAGSSALNTVLLTATVTDTSASRSLAIAKAVATLFGPMVDDLEDRTGVNSALVKLDVTSGPTLNPVPISPRKTVDVGLGLVLGLVLGLALAVVRELLDRSVHTVEDLAALVDRPVLGSIPVDTRLRRTSVVSEDGGPSVLAESYRQIRTSIGFLQIGPPLKVIVVTSSVPGEGRSQTAANLAIKFAELGRKVVLVQADLRHQSGDTDGLGFDGRRGLSNALIGEITVQDALQPWGTHGLMVMPKGDTPPNPSELLASPQMGVLVSTLRSLFDVVLLDTPPVLPYSDAKVLTQHADGVLFVVRQGRTNTGTILKSISSFESVRDKVLGTVLTMTPVKGVDAG